MPRHIEEPTVTTVDDETIITHPAFAQIGVSRVQGNANLYGSDFQHQHFMIITVRRSELHRRFSRDWEMAGDELIEVALSEAQWASFVSSPNVGSGVTCTLHHVNGQPVPLLPKPEATHKKFQAEMMEQMAQLQADLRELAEGIDGPLNKTRAHDIKTKIDRISERLVNNTGFVAKQFDSHIEKTVEKAKIEINAYTTNMVMRTGIEAMQNQIPAIEFNSESGESAIE